MAISGGSCDSPEASPGQPQAAVPQLSTWDEKQPASCSIPALGIRLLPRFRKTPGGQEGFQSRRKQIKKARIYAKKPNSGLLGAKSVAGASNTSARGLFEEKHQLTPQVRVDQPVRAARCISATGWG